MFERVDKAEVLLRKSGEYVAAPVYKCRLDGEDGYDLFAKMGRKYVRLRHSGYTTAKGIGWMNLTCPFILCKDRIQAL